MREIHDLGELSSPDRRKPWRSMLFVPANVEKYVERAAERQADAIILDLEDAVLPRDKQQARESVAAAAAAISAQGVDVFVRVNRPWRALHLDISAAVSPGITGLVLPKVESAAFVSAVHELLDDLEAERRLSPGHTQLHVLIETPRGLEAVTEILRASHRIVAASTGPGDLAASAGFSYDGVALQIAHVRVVTAALATGCLPMGLAGIPTEFRDLDAFRRLAIVSRGLGSVGAACIHPSQVPILNEVFQPSDSEVTWAKSVLEAFASADDDPSGRGAFMLDGEFVDLAMIQRAQRLLATEPSRASTDR